MIVWSDEHECYVIDHEALDDALDHAAEEYGLERSEHAREVGRLVAGLQD
jgi:hypothetical protein